MPGPWDNYAAPATPAADAGPWAKYGGASPPAATSEPTGISAFLQNLLPQAVQHPEDAIKQEFQNEKADASNLIHHPIKSLFGLPSFNKDAAIPGAVRAVAAGNPAEAAVDLTSMVPGGQSLINAAEKPDVGGTGSYLGDLKSTIESPSAMGTLVGGAAQIAPMVVGGADMAMPDRSTFGAIPTRAKAGDIFNSLNEKLADHPVPLTNSLKPLQRATELGVRGSTLPGPVDALLKRSQMIEPMTFPEARDYQSSLSDLSASDKLSMNKRMSGAVKQLNKSLYDDIHSAADSAGSGDDYEQAMRDFRRASTVKDVASKAAKYGIGAAGLGIGGHYLQSLIPGR